MHRGKKKIHRRIRQASKVMIIIIQKKKSGVMSKKNLVAGGFPSDTKFFRFASLGTSPDRPARFPASRKILPEVFPPGSRQSSRSSLASVPGIRDAGGNAQAGRTPDTREVVYFSARKV